MIAKNPAEVELAEADAEAARIESEPPKPKRHPWAKRKGAIIFAVSVFLVSLLICGSLAFWLFGFSIWAAIGVLIVCALLSCSIRIAFAWERVVVLRFGNFSRIAQPGLYFTIPVIEQVALHVDQRINATPFLNERALTSDLAPIDIDAVVFWMVWDAKRAYTQVADYPEAVSWSAQTALRDAIGQVSLTDVPIKRLQIDHEVQERLDRKVEDWGISIISVEIRDIMLPSDLQDAMSKAAQAERERDARIILAEAEKEASAMFVEAAEVYKDSEIGLQLRIANLLCEGMKETGGMVVVPSSIVENAALLEKGTRMLEDITFH